MFQPQITFIIPFYNVEKYFDKCIASVCGQTLNDIEILLIDDCGTDGSRAIADKWAARDSRIRIVENPKNIGIGKSYNAGIANASGEYIAFVDSDDFIANNYADTLLYAASKTGAEMVFGRAIAVDEDGGNQQNYYPFGLAPCRGLFMHPNDCRHLTIWGVLFSADLLRRHSGIRFESDGSAIWNEDTGFAFMFAALSNYVAEIPQAVYYYRQRAHSVQSQFFTDGANYALAEFVHANKVLEWFRNVYLGACKSEWVYQAEALFLTGCFKPMFFNQCSDREQTFQLFKKVVKTIHKSYNPRLYKLAQRVLRITRRAKTHQQFLRLVARRIRLRTSLLSDILYNDAAMRVRRGHPIDWLIYKLNMLWQNWFDDKDISIQNFETHDESSVQKHMTFEEFTAGIEPDAEEVNLYYTGDLFGNKDLRKMMKFAKQNSFILTIREARA
ncbi:MAG: glycosyltransferase [Rickettsiales bacterium]|jgi:glycosyltransferase involved in cell wall biosynthesis|nr:glycosyltransferase [Rickettsiales bacterium]